MYVFATLSAACSGPVACHISRPRCDDPARSTLPCRCLLRVVGCLRRRARVAHLIFEHLPFPARSAGSTYQLGIQRRPRSFEENIGWNGFGASTATNGYGPSWGFPGKLSGGGLLHRLHWGKQHPPHQRHQRWVHRDQRNCSHRSQLHYTHWSGTGPPSRTALAAIGGPPQATQTGKQDDSALYKKKDGYRHTVRHGPPWKHDGLRETPGWEEQVDLRRTWDGGVCVCGTHTGGGQGLVES